MRTELRNIDFYKKTVRLMIPVALQQLISAGVNFMDNLMIGEFGETAIAAASFSNQFYSLFNFITMGLGSGAIVLSAQFWGRKELESMRKVAAIAMRLAIALCALFTLISVFTPQNILRVFTKEAVVITAGIPYLRLIGTTFLLSGLSYTSSYLLRSVGNVRIPLIGSAGAFVLNIFFNWVFIFGKLGAPRLELLGAAVGTVIARVFECGFIFGFFVLRDKRIGFRLKHIFQSAGTLWRPYFIYGLPVLVSDTLLGTSVSLISVILGHMGKTASASAAIVASLIGLLDIVNTSMGGASAIVIGNTVGSGDLVRAKREGTTYNVISFIIGFILLVPLCLISEPYLAAYNITDETLSLARLMILYNCITLPLQANTFITSKGVLRGGGDTRFLLVADSILVWVFSLPVGALLGLVLHVPPIWVYVVLRIQFPLKGIICLIRYISGNWIKVITAKEE